MDYQPIVLSLDNIWFNDASPKYYKLAALKEQERHGTNIKDTKKLKITLSKFPI
jgi:hypothetical protein